MRERILPEQENCSERKQLPPFLINTFLEFNLEPPPVLEIPKERYPIIVIFGPPGGGKTEAAKRLETRFGFKVLYERLEENEFVSSSYSKSDPEIGLKSQIKFLLLKFQDYLRAPELACQKPVLIEPGIKIDRCYSQTFRELGKMSEEQHQKYLTIWNTMEPFIFPEDLAISVIPDEETYNSRIKSRGRDYEQAGFTDEFKRRMVELCREEEREWRNKGLCLSIGHLDYVHGDIDSTLLVREFGLKATEVWGGQKEVRGSDGVRVLCPSGWGGFKVGPGERLRWDDCRFKKGY